MEQINSQTFNSAETLNIYTEGGEVDQIEVGGPYAGIEFHHGSIQPNRISFFYPAANTVDISEGYRERGNYPVMTFRLKAGGKTVELTGGKPFNSDISPYMLTFDRQDKDKYIKITYEFCKSKPAMVMKFQLTNNSSEEEEFSLDTSLEKSLKTSCTYNFKNDVETEFDDINKTIYTKHRAPETQNAAIFVANAGEVPSGSRIEGEKPGRPEAGFSYNRKLEPGEKMTVIQIIGSCRNGEEKAIVKDLRDNYQEETESYKHYINNKVYDHGKIFTGNDDLDKTALWTKGIMAANAHYLDGQIVPMPCPAEYNFFFTHDTLQTDFTAVIFDPDRVKKDLLYIASLAKEDGIIPHAYYWKDAGYHTEFAGADNWNHAWFVTVSGKYLRHTGDTETLEKLYPLLSKSVEQMLVNKKDDLIYANRPDWWDIGDSFGPRAYMTIHAIHSLREFAYINTILGKNLSEKYEEIAKNMQKELAEKLWDEDRGYLLNYFNDGSKDTHYYTGSLLAAHYDLLSSDKKERMINTAQKKLLDEKTGIYNAYPMDFHELGDYLHFYGDEMGEPFYYMNGGIWYHGNAWYALALISAGKKDDALKFMEETMTLGGIMKGPGGQPAMYECRNGNSKDPENYGKVDKPQFLWASAWYLYTLYNLLGYRENEWNMSFDPYIPKGQDRTEYEIIAGGKTVKVETKGRGNYIQDIKYDGVSCPSAVIPEDFSPGKRVEITPGNPANPYISSAGSILLKPSFDRSSGKFKFTLKSFPGHFTGAEIVSPGKLKAISLNGKELKGSYNVEKKDGVYIINIAYSQENEKDTFEIQFDLPEPGSY